jgi:hypothetical protein
MNTEDSKLLYDMHEELFATKRKSIFSPFKNAFWAACKLSILIGIGLIVYEAVTYSMAYQEKISELGLKSPAHAFISSKLNNCLSELEDNSVDHCLARIITLSEAQGVIFSEQVKTATQDYSQLYSL